MPREERTFFWFICYDFEAILQKVDDRPTETLAWTHQHNPTSESLCSNIETHRGPVCLVGEMDIHETETISVSHFYWLWRNSMSSVTIAKVNCTAIRVGIQYQLPFELYRLINHLYKHLFFYEMLVYNTPVVNFV